ncbi:MAG: DNA repair protein RecO [Eubacterium sp.]|nr:DNA repair protein RecO [Eubacterium sp.]
MKEKYIGIVLSAATIGEYDKRVVLLSRENGRLSAFVRGARRPKSPLSAVTEPFCFGEFFVFRGRDSYTIEEVHAENYFPALRADLDALFLGMYFCEVADYFTREGMRADQELELLYRGLTALTQSGIPTDLIRRIYELRMLAVSGFSPHYDEKEKCWHDDIGRWSLSETASYTVGQILTRPLRNLFSFKVSDTVQAELATVIDRFFKRNTDKSFHSLDAL